ncbi:beta-N-acetylhexosaminidase [Bacteroidales bacterium OttesenSCG-928-M11]|nr:beta-N-acetylhexosaminidase [Bacteroidales bacterium OttesenSCG-928-M11]
MKLFLTFLLFCFSFPAFSGIDKLLPKPQSVKRNDQKFYIDKLKLNNIDQEIQWIDFFEKAGATIDRSTRKEITINLVDDLVDVPINKDEAYRLSVKSQKIEIEAITEKGVYWAMQTLRQLIVKQKNKSYFEGCEIIDYPAFRIRGFMQDVGRTYISLDELKREIAKLSEYKINVFHWHLTENQGWRLQSKIFPMLNDSINYERMPAKFYSLDEVRQLVDFCKQHNVLLIPEIDMPGHSLAFEKTFRHNMQSKEGMIILKLLLDEICETFDVPYLHIGTDEVKFTNPAFVPEMVDYIRSKGKKVISWNPGWNYKPGEIDMTQLWSYRGKPQAGIPAIDSRFHYINHFDAFADIIALYNSRILNSDQGCDDVAGCIIALWNDRYITSEKDIIIQNNFYPSLLALAERSWIGGGSEYFDKNGTVLPNKDDLVFKSFCDFEERMLWHKKNNFSTYPFAYVKQTNIHWRITSPFPNNGDLLASFPPENELSDTYEYNGKVYKTQDAIGAGVYLRHVWGNNIIRSFYDEPKPNHTAYAYTYVYSPKKQKVGLWMSFQNYSRSEKDLPPPQGKWDYKESRLWINNKEIQPPIWESNHTVFSNEIPLTNENFEVRPPLPVDLEKGWNKVLLKLPVGQFTTSEIRLVKWMFNCIFVTPDGKDSVEGLIYSPDKSMK